MNKEKAFLGLPQDFKQKFLIYPPTVKQVVGTEEFNQFRALFTISQEDLEDIFIKDNKKKGFVDYDKFKVPTPFEYLLASCYHNKEVEQVAKDGFYFFTKQPIEFIYEKGVIIIGDLEEELKRVKSNLGDFVLLQEEDYFDFQNEIRKSLGDKPVVPPNPNENPRVRRMKALARYRDKIKAKNGNGINLQTTLSAICCMGIGITPLNIGELSYASLFTLISVYQEKEKYGIDVRSLQAGADSKKVKPKYWIRNLDE